MTNKTYETAKRIGRKALTTGLVALALTGCGSRSTVVPEQRNGKVYLATAKNVEIMPHYGEDKMFMDGISVITNASGDGLTVPATSDTTVYIKGSSEYNTLRPLLTVEKACW